MKLLCACFFFLVLSASAQINDKPVKLLQYVLDSFTSGSVKLRSGAVSFQKLNYNIVTAEMIFEQAGTYFAIAHPEEVDTVFIAGRKFVFVNEVFYEWIGGVTFPLFAAYTFTIKEPGAQTGFGTTTTTASTSFKSLMKNAGAYSLKLPDEYEIVAKQTFYIGKQGQYYKVGKEQELVNLFPSKKELIKSWIKEHNTRFSNVGEVFSLIQQIQY